MSGPDWAMGIFRGETMPMPDLFRLTAAGAQRALGDPGEAGKLVSIHARRLLDGTVTVDVWDVLRGPPYVPIALNMDVDAVEPTGVPGGGRRPRAAEVSHGG